MGYVCLLGAAQQFSPYIQMGPHQLILCSTFIFLKVLAFYHSNHQSTSFVKVWCHQKENSAKVETVNYLKVVGYVVSGRRWESLCFPQKFDISCGAPARCPWDNVMHGLGTAALRSSGRSTWFWMALKSSSVLLSRTKWIVVSERNKPCPL